jgi:hypothetical protein
VSAAEPKETSAPVIGLTRDQVIARYGEPRSQIIAGNRLIMFFARERIVLRDGRVVEVERLATETRPAAPAPTPGAPATGPTTDTPATASPPAERTGAAGAVPPASTPAAPAGSPIEALDPNAPPPAPAQARSGPEPKLEIKSVRGPSANYVPPPVTKQTVRPAAPAPARAPVTPPAADPRGTAVTNSAAVPSSAPPSSTIARTETKSSESVPTGPAAAASPSMSAPPSAGIAAQAPEGKSSEKAREDVAADEKKAKEEKLRAVRARRRIAEAGDPDEPDFTEAFYTTRTFVIIAFVVAGGLAYLLWRARQRQLLLAATAVSQSPFSAAAQPSGGGGATFTPELLSKLEWKRFEELVADYYSKTGVVAVRTKSGPASPVHIKISWKGEPRPFACVQCLAHPQGLVDAKPLQELMTALTAEDIRRGYVITSGKFSVPARDYAEEKHLTLLPGDIFLEKLNALPEAARTEIIQVVTTGDYQTPSCPKCETKMVKSLEDSSLWRCPTHADQVIPAWR